MNISMFNMDCLAIILLFVFTQFSPTEEILDDKWNTSIWQQTLFSSYREVAKNGISDEISLNVVFCSNKILKNCWSSLNANGWTALIEVIHELIKKDDDHNLFQNGKNILNLLNII